MPVFQQASFLSLIPGLITKYKIEALLLKKQKIK